MSSDSSRQLVISWEKTTYQDLEEEKAINRELEHFILDILNRNRFVRYCNLCSQSAGLNCSSCNRIDCARGIFRETEMLRDKVPVWFSDIVSDRARGSVKQCSRSKSITFLEGESS